MEAHNHHVLFNGCSLIHCSRGVECTDRNAFSPGMTKAPARSKRIIRQRSHRDVFKDIKNPLTVLPATAQKVCELFIKRLTPR
jgi:hypothetical protein